MSDWSELAERWAELWAGLAQPAREAVLHEVGVGPGTDLLDVGCGSGEFVQMAADRGAAVSGIDAAEGMVAIARRRLPSADIRLGSLEQLPWPDAGFDLVTGFNSFQFAGDVVAALTEAARVTRPSGAVVVCVWGERGDRGIDAITDRLEALVPDREPQEPTSTSLGAPGGLEDALRHAGLEPARGDWVDVPYVAPDLATLERAFLWDAELLGVTEAVDEHTLRRTIGEAGEQFRRPDGSYRIENRFRYVVAQR